MASIAQRARRTRAASGCMPGSSCASRTLAPTTATRPKTSSSPSGIRIAPTVFCMPSTRVESAGTGTESVPLPRAPVHIHAHFPRTGRHQPEASRVELRIVFRGAGQVGHRRKLLRAPSAARGRCGSAVTSAARLRISISATPGTTCGGRIVTSSWYGPAWPSKNTSGLPTCAASGAAAARRSAARIFMSYRWMRRIQLPAAMPNRVVRIALASASPSSCQSRAPCLGGEKPIVHIQRVRRCEIFEVLRAEEPVARPRRHQEIRKGPLHRREDRQEDRARNQRLPPSAPIRRALPQQIQRQRRHNQQQREIRAA